MDKTYMDYAATTPTDPRVVEAMLPYFTEKFGNSATLYSIGQEAEAVLEECRRKVAKILGAKSSEIFFTSGGTESDNLALKGVALARGKGHIITSQIEHHAVLHTAEWLEKQGYSVTYLPVDKYGIVSPESVSEAIKEDTILVSIMHGNNEIGTIQPIDEIGKICRKKRIYFHTDAVQTVGKVPVSLKNVDLMSSSSHKIYGPKGVGLIYIRNSVQIVPLIHGGGHENGMRSGTENISGIVGYTKALELAVKEMKTESKKLWKFNKKLVEGLGKISDSWLNGHPEKRLPGNVHFCFSFIEGESLILLLDQKGIEASTGSACSSKSLKPSHVLTAIGLKPEEAHGSLRLTMGRFTEEKDVERVLREVPGVVERLRKVSPLSGE
ncbi:MAG: cysteine desulfurase [Candidatus Aenigmarchaeota archaeon]|nr:cysteine desulfurase [Candidatus Aenigmarchaeota archaeon]